ncbi:MAG: hypothetical protein ABF313_15610, partial [Marivita sp.]
IAMESNGQVQASVTDQLAPFGVTGDRIYINFFVSANCLFKKTQNTNSNNISYTYIFISIFPLHMYVLSSQDVPRANVGWNGLLIPF